MYRQFDGYPEGMGEDLKKALAGRVLVNGFNDAKTQCNGMGCLAAMVVAELKEGCGNVYLHAPGTSDIWEDYVYTLSKGEALPPAPRVSESYAIILKVQSGSEVLYDGPLSEFDSGKLKETEES